MKYSTSTILTADWSGVGTALDDILSTGYRLEKVQTESLDESANSISHAAKINE